MELCDERLKPFIGNDPNHIGYNKSFESNILLPIETFATKLRAFSEEIQKAVNSSVNEKPE